MHRTGILRLALSKLPADFQPFFYSIRVHLCPSAVQISSLYAEKLRDRFFNGPATLCVLSLSGECPNSHGWY